MHIANAGGVWAALVHGFAGLVDTGEHLRFEPRLPEAWASLRFRIMRHGSKLLVTVDGDGATIELVDGPPVPIEVGLDDTVEIVDTDRPLRIHRPTD